MSQGFYGFPRILDIVRATSFKALGKIGATNGAALAGGTLSGAPVAPAGPFDVGDVVVGANATLWICTTAGTSQSSPGSFTQVGGATSPLTTKGDVWVYGSADSRLAVGSDNQVLIADAAQTLGVKWATPSAPAVRCYNSSTITVPSGTPTAATFNTNRYDQNTTVAQHSTSSNTSRLTCQVAGIYAITALWGLAHSGSGRFDTYLQVNGTTIIAYDGSYTDTSTPYHSLSAQWQMAVADYVEVVFSQGSGFNATVQVNAAFSPEFMMARLG